MTQEGFDFQQSVAYKTAEIPCKPTHPNISVSLTLQGKGPVEVDNTFIKFNPKVIYINIIHINTIHFNIVHFNIIHSNIIQIKLSKMIKLINQIFHEDFFQVGFMISPVLPEHSGQYWCYAKYGQKTSEYGVSLRVLMKTK